jgi:hypothetical protein
MTSENLSRKVMILIGQCLDGLNQLVLSSKEGLEE